MGHPPSSSFHGATGFLTRTRMRMLFARPVHWLGALTALTAWLSTHAWVDTTGVSPARGSLQ
eukprot:15476673-Alexandrium_andersonii.AAC.1